MNYRTSHQIRMQADRLLGPAVTDVDGNSEDRSDTVSVFNGPPPVIRNSARESEEIEAVADWIAEQAQGRRCCRTSSACSCAPPRNWTGRTAAVEAGRPAVHDSG